MDRRTFLSGTIGVAALSPASAAVDPFDLELRGTIDPAQAGALRPNAPDDQGLALQRLLDEASAADRPLILPAGRFVVSNVRLPLRTRLSGVAGATRLVLGSGGSFLQANGSEIVDLRDLALIGEGQTLEPHIPALLHIANSHRVRIENCEVLGSSASGIALDRSGGRIRDVTVMRAAGSGIRAVEATGLSILDCAIEECGAGGIEVTRWRAGEDATVVNGNRIARIGARETGPTESGHGISIFRAHGVLVANNTVSDCARNGIQAHGAADIRILGNLCSRSGEGISVVDSARAVAANNITKAGRSELAFSRQSDL